jgi:cyclase
LLLKNAGLVKTKKFRKPQYVGDPINAVRIFNEKEVDELVFLDIMATPCGRRPNFELIEQIARECFIPFSYGGGITSLDDIYRLLRLGVEKVVLNSIAVEKPALVAEAAKAFGSSTIIGAIDVQRNLFGRLCRRSHGGRVVSSIDPTTVAKELEDLGVGEIFLNSVDRDGTRLGYDVPLIAQVNSALEVPMIACGGAGSVDHMRVLLRESRVAGLAAGSLFVFHGPMNAVLINYPPREELADLVTNHTFNSTVEKLAGSTC